MPGGSSSAAAAIDGGFELVDRLTDEAVDHWARFTRLLRRLAFKRRCFGHLGQWLKVIKSGLRDADHDGAARRSSGGPDRRAPRR